MTLHSISTSYPESPTLAEKNLTSAWLDMFRDTITCPHCREHFGEILANSRKILQNLLNTRQDFAELVFRVHNTVNRRLKNPDYDTVGACMERLRENVKNRTARDYRQAYLNHIARFWKTFQDISGLVALKKINEMRRIEAEYFGPKDTNFNVDIREDLLTVPRGVLERESPEEVPRVFSPRPVAVIPERVPSRMPLGVGYKMTAGGLRLR